MSNLPRIALVTPSYNTARHIGATIASVLEQDYGDVDYLIMDGASTDDTLNILRSYGDRLRWISQPDAGQSDAIRRGFEQTRGEILGWLNSDDTLGPGTLGAVAAFFADHPDVAMVYGDAAYIDACGRLIGPCVHVEPFNAERLYHYSDFIVQPAAFFRRDAYDAVGGLDPSLHYGMDYDLWLKLAKRFEIAYLPRHLANYRWMTDNKTAVGGWGRLDEISALVARHGFDPPAFIQLERANLHLRDSLTALRRGAVGKSIAAMSRAAAMGLSSRRAVWSMFQPHTWRVIWMGQVLRTRAARAANDAR